MTVVIGHRGASADFPENTLDAFAGAAAQGADWVELDVRATSDGVLVVHHDAVLPDGRPIADLAHHEVPISVPRLEAAFGVMAGMGVNVEIKNSPAEPGWDPTGELASATVELIAEVAAGLEILVSCFDLATLDHVRAVAPHLATGYLVLSAEEPVDAVAAAVASGCVAVNPWDPCVSSESIARAHDAGLAVNVWTVDDPDRIRQLAEWGADAVITNRPAVALSALGRG